MQEGRCRPAIIPVATYPGEVYKRQGYSFSLPEPGTKEAANLDALDAGQREKLVDNLKVGVYDSAHESLVNGGANADGSFNINTGNSNLIPTQNVDVYVKGTNDRPVFTDENGNVIAEVVTEANGKTCLLYTPRSV